LPDGHGKRGHHHACQRIWRQGLRRGAQNAFCDLFGGQLNTNNNSQDELEKELEDLEQEELDEKYVACF
jgi:hypothetical protein